MPLFALSGHRLVLVHCTAGMIRFSLVGPTAFVLGVPLQAASPRWCHCHRSWNSTCINIWRWWRCWWRYYSDIASDGMRLSSVVSRSVGLKLLLIAFAIATIGPSFFAIIIYLGYRFDLIQPEPSGYRFSIFIRELPFDFAIINWGFVALYLACRIQRKATVQS